MRLGTCLLIGGHTPQGALHKLADFCSAPVAGFYSAVDNQEGRQRVRRFPCSDAMPPTGAESFSFDVSGLLDKKFDEQVVEFCETNIFEVFRTYEKGETVMGVTDLGGRECPKLCVWGLAHAVKTGHLLNRSGYRIANRFRAATHSLTHRPDFSKLRMAR